MKIPDNKTVNSTFILRRINLLVSLAGVSILALILYGYYNGERLHDLNSPLLSAVKEIRLTANATRLGVSEFLEAGTGQLTQDVWNYLDKSIWYFENLIDYRIEPFRHVIPIQNKNVREQIDGLKSCLEDLKHYSVRQAEITRGKDEIAPAILIIYDQKFTALFKQLDFLENSIVRTMRRDQELFRYSHAGLALFCIILLLTVWLTIRQYEHRRAVYVDAIKETNAKLEKEVAERKQVDVALKESENLFRTIFETSPDPIIVSSLRDNRISDVNNGFLELTGFNRNEILGKTALDLTLWENTEKRDRFIAILESGKRIRNFESRFRMKNGHFQTALLSVNVVELKGEPHFITVARNVSELKEAEYALKESEEKFRGLFEHAVDFIHFLDIEGRILLSNPAAIRGLGYPPSQLQNRSLADFVDPAVKPYFEDMLPHLADHGHFRKECNLTTGDGRTITVDCSAAPVRNDAGKVDFIVVFQEDISDRKSAERKLLAAYEYLQIANRHNSLKPLLTEFIAAMRRMTGCSFAAVRIPGEDGFIPYAVVDGFSAKPCGLEDLPALENNETLCARVLKNETAAGRPNFTSSGSFYTNRASTEASGLCTRSDCALVGYNSLALIPIRLGQQNLGLVYIADEKENMLTAETVDIFETATMQLGTAIRRLRAEEGLQTAYQVLEDRVTERTRELSQVNAELEAQIEERRRAEDRLRKNHNTLQTIIDGLADALILVDRDMRIRMVNRKTLELFNITRPDKAIGQACFHINGQIGPCDGCKIPQAVARGQSITFERGGLTDNNRLEEISIYPVQEGENDEGGAIVRIADITEAKHFERQLIQSEKMASLGILVSSIAHEINNPNSFVTFNIPILREYLEELVEIADIHAENQLDFELFHMTYPEFRKDVFKLVDNIEHGASRISTFVANLREFSQSNGNRQKVMLDLPEIVDKVLSICRSQIKKRVKTFELDMSADLPPVYADAYSLEQVLLNLIVNAVQAADKKDSFVKLRASSGQSWREHTIIEVSDNGCGIDKKKIDRIFDPFFTTKSVEEGTGLGLYVCHNLIEGLGGSIVVESRLGEGSTFIISLPDKDRRKKPRSADDVIKKVPA